MTSLDSTRHELAERNIRRWLLNEEVRQRMEKRNIEENVNVIIVGRGGRFILPRERGLSVRILAPLDFRAEQIMLQQGITYAEATQLVQRVDRERRAFKQKYFHHNSADPHEYDFVINVEKLGQQDAAELIVSAVRCWLKKSGLRSVSSETVVAQPVFQLNP